MNNDSEPKPENPLAGPLAQRFMELCEMVAGEDPADVWENTPDSDKATLTMVFSHLLSETPLHTVISIEPGDALSLIVTNPAWSYEDTQNTIGLFTKAYPGVQFNVVLAGAGTTVVKGTQGVCGDPPPHGLIPFGTGSMQLVPSDCILKKGHDKAGIRHKDTNGTEWEHTSSQYDHDTLVSLRDEAEDKARLAREQVQVADDAEEEARLFRVAGYWEKVAEWVQVILQSQPNKLGGEL